MCHAIDFAPCRPLLFGPNRCALLLANGQAGGRAAFLAPLPPHAFWDAASPPLECQLLHFLFDVSLLFISILPSASLFRQRQSPHDFAAPGLQNKSLTSFDF
jgi:hypothetical protein